MNSRFLWALVAIPSFTQLVDTRIGTDLSPTALHGARSEKMGDTQPSSAVPFGMVQWGPDTQHPQAGSYYYRDNEITGFSLTHMSGTGCNSTSELSVLPSTGTHATFSHADEVAQPGYYSVKLSSGVQVELSGTERTGFGRFSFPPATKPRIAIDYQKTGTGWHEGSLRVLDEHALGGWVQGGNFCGAGTYYKVYFAIRLDQPIRSQEDLGGVLTLHFASVEAIRMKVGISYVSEDNALLNLKAEGSSWDFEEVHSKADAAWEAELSKISLEGGSESEQRTFYTALYHVLLHPNVYSDVNGQYLGFDHRIHATSETPTYKTHYANFSGWDIYRSEIQLLAVLDPGRTSEIIQSLVNDASQCGAFPKWANNDDETGEMVGDPGSAIVASAYAFGATAFDTDTALAIMRKSALSPGTKCNRYETRPGLKQYLGLGYVPDDLKIWDVGSAAVTLEYNSADFAISQFARALGDDRLARETYGHAAFWKNLWDGRSGLIRPKSTAGGWIPWFNPASTLGFVEGNSAQYTWMVPFDPPSLLQSDLDLTLARLAEFFKSLNSWHGAHLWIGNEPGFFAPWIYNWLGAPSQTQALVSRILSEDFSDQPGGLPGNDDLGATSSWYVWAAMGLYPALPGVGGFVIGEPLFPGVTLTLAEGRQLGITRTDGAPGAIQSATLDGVPYTRSWIDWSRLSWGATLHYEVSPGPSSWGTQAKDLPPSYSDFSP